jgi:hypothetical protein
MTCIASWATSVGQTNVRRSRIEDCQPGDSSLCRHTHAMTTRIGTSSVAIATSLETRPRIVSRLECVDVATAAATRRRSASLGPARSASSFTTESVKTERRSKISRSCSSKLTSETCQATSGMPSWVERPILTEHS